MRICNIDKVIQWFQHFSFVKVTLNPDNHQHNNQHKTKNVSLMSLNV